MSENFTFTQDEGEEFAGHIWAVEDTFDENTSQATKDAFKALHDWAAELAEEKGFPVPAQRGGTPKDNPPPPPPPGG